MGSGFGRCPTTDFAGDLLALANEADVKGFPLIRILSLWYVVLDDTPITNRRERGDAVNRCTRAGFSAFINELRIKEAVRLMSGDRLKNLTMEGIAREAGFNKRSTFYRAFKKATGFSPMDYLGNSGLV